MGTTMKNPQLISNLMVKDWMFSPKFRNKTMFTLAASIQHSARGSSQDSWA